MSLPIRPLGATGLHTTALGFGAMQLGAPEIDETTAGSLLHAVLDLGIRLIDTARSYGLSEERIGRHLGARRDEFVLSTKVGYGVDGVPDWTPECVRRGIEDARRRLQTDVIDIVHLHSCDSGTLWRPGLVEALEDAVARGVVRVAAYSGDNEPAGEAAQSGRFGVMQCSVNVWDQDALRLTPTWSARGVGVLGKRPLAGLPWREVGQRDAAHTEYRRRFEATCCDAAAADWTDVAIRFAAFTPGVSACLVGGTRVAHVEQNIRSLSRGPLEATTRERFERAFARAGAGWRGMV